MAASPARKRRISAILETQDLEFDHGKGRNDELTDNEILQSGMMLNHCILYRELNFKMDNAPAVFGISKADDSKPGIMVQHFDTNNMLTEKKITFAETKEFFRSVFPSLDGFVWLHMTSRKILPLIFKEFNMHPIVIKSFMDTLPRTTLNFFDEDTAMITMISFCRQPEGHICAKKLFLYIKGDVVISYERLTHAEIKEIAEEAPASAELVPSAPATLKKALSMKPTTHQVAVMKEEAESPRPNDVATPINPAAVRPDTSDAPIVNRTTTGLKSHTNYTGRAYTDLSDRLRSPLVQHQLRSVGASYILYEALYVMLEMTTPVIAFYSKHQLRLHDTVNVRDREPTHSEGNAILDRVDFIKAGFQLMENLIDRSTKGLVENKDRLLTILPGEWIYDVISSYEHSLDVVTDMDKELDRITDNINGIIGRRNEQIGIVLSLVATVFLPLTFFAGIFGMNFESGGIIVYMLQQHNGTNWFWGSCLVTCVICGYIFVRKGWMDMLGKVRRGGQWGQKLNSHSEKLLDYFMCWKKKSET